MMFLNAVFTWVMMLQIFTLVHAADTAAWKPRSIYFVLTDRMARSSNDTGGESCSNLAKYCGGTFQGLESKLDYIKNLGFDAIWITPVVANSADGYHGYWARDLYELNSNYGTAADLKSLVNKAHSKGIYVMVDVVANHMGPANIVGNRPAPLNEASSYHSACAIDYSNQSSVENCRLANLPDIDTQKPEIRALMKTWVGWLVQEYGFDGVRIDTVKHVEKDFWPGFVSAIGAYAIGEVLDTDPSYLAAYANVMPGLLNYAVYLPMNRFYQQRGSAQALVDSIDSVSALFPDPAALGTFLDNHDNPRWLSQKNDQTLLKNALAFVMLARGIPILYYGTEQGYAGGRDPANREDLWRSGFNANTSLYQAIAKLAAVRKAAGGLAGNDHTHLYAADTAYAWSRAAGKLIVLTTTNAGSSSSSSAPVQHCFNTARADGRWTDVYGDGGRLVTADCRGRVCVDVVGGQPVVLMAATSTASTTSTTTTVCTLCPTAVSVSFAERVTTVFGDTVKITGNSAQLGNWDATKAPALSASQYTTNNPIWNITLTMRPGQAVQYKFVKLTSSGGLTWESDPNRVYTVPDCQASAYVTNEWR